MRIRFNGTTSLIGVVGAGLLAASVALPALAAPVTEGRLAQAANEPQNWLMTYGTYDGHRYSRNTQINRSNVSDLKMAFTMPLHSHRIRNAGLQGAPLVDDGMLYMADGHGNIYKIDVRDGVRPEVLWLADAAVDEEESPVSRGIGLYRDTVITGLVDGRIIAVDRDTGETVWDKQIARIDPPWVPSPGFYDMEKFNVAPIMADGKAIFGIANGDAGLIGWTNAVDALTGEEVWRHYNIPLPGEPGHETWADDHNAWMTGGAAIWTTGTYDPETNITYQGTSNPVPMFDPEYRPGDNLWTNSVLAIDVGNGELVWGYQYTANESWDFDENGVHLLFDTMIGGQNRQVVSHFARNGFYYSLDRTNGDFIQAVQYVQDLNWTDGLDPKTGKPIEYDPNALVQLYKPYDKYGNRIHGLREFPDFMVCPTLVGGLRWQPPAYNPVKQIAYGAGAEGCSVLKVVPEEHVVGEYFIGGQFNNDDLVNPAPTYGSITAMDVQSHQIVAKRILEYQSRSGVLATAGGLVFAATDDGILRAFDDESLEELWTFSTGILIKGPFISYAHGGKQYLAIMAGGGDTEDTPAENASASMLFVFTL
jgi:alcohol dehydrogenase (cytochrome c)